MSATLGSSTAAMVGRAPARHRQARAAKIPSPPLGTSGIVGLRPPSSTTSITSYRRPLGPPSASANVATDMTLSDERKKELAREFIETGSGYFTPPREELFAGRSFTRDIHEHAN